MITANVAFEKVTENIKKTREKELQEIRAALDKKATPLIENAIANNRFYFVLDRLSQDEIQILREHGYKVFSDSRANYRISFEMDKHND